MAVPTSFRNTIPGQGVRVIVQCVSTIGGFLARVVIVPNVWVWRRAEPGGGGGVSWVYLLAILAIISLSIPG